jgi:hypothetical protein
MSVVFIFMGLILFIYGAIGINKDRTRLFKKRCTKETVGILDGFDDEKILTRKVKDYYYYEKYSKIKTNTVVYTSPIFLFKVDNEEYRATYFRPIEKKLKIGQKMNIQYNPENPYEYIVIGDKYLNVNSKSAQSTGIILILLGIGLIILKSGII